MRYRLVFAVAVLAALIIPGSASAKPRVVDPVYGVPVTSELQLTLSEEQAFVVRLERQIEKLPVGHPIETQDDLYAWALEIIPYFGYEGLVDYGDLRAPADIVFKYNSGERNFHVLGQAACYATGKEEGNIFINARYSSPVDPWYGRDDALWTLTHELQHMQGGTFCDGPSYQLETNTQLGATEVMAAMVNYGSTQALRPFLEGVRDMGVGAIESTMDHDAFNAWYAKLFHNDPIRMARFWKSTRHWEADPFGLKDILDKYEKVPFDAIMTGLRTGYVPRVQVADVVQVPGSETATTHAEDLDDAKYLLAYPTLENLVTEIAVIPAN